MRARRTVYIVIFVVASLVAAGAYYLAQPRIEIVRATADIAVLTQITADMVELVRVSPLDAPADTARSLDAVVGQYAALPILAGQDVDARAIEATPGSRAFGFGAPLGPGEVAFALPVDGRPGGRRRAVAGGPGRRDRRPERAQDRGRPRRVRARARSSMGQGLTILALRTADGHQLTDARRRRLDRASSRRSSARSSSRSRRRASPTSRPPRSPRPSTSPSTRHRRRRRCHDALLRRSTPAAERRPWQVPKSGRLAHRAGQRRGRCGSRAASSPASSSRR